MEPWSSIHDFREDIKICKLPWWSCSCDWAEKARKFEMNEETKNIIAGYPNISIEDARLIFIRQRGREDWKTRSATFEGLINTPTPIKDAPRDQVIAYINFLDTMIKELRVYSQGLKIEYAKEVEPEIESNYKEREAKKDAKKSSPRTLDGMLAKLGMSKEDLIAAIKRKQEAKGMS